MEFPIRVLCVFSWLNRGGAERVDERPLNRIVNKPENFDRLKKVAEALSEDFPEARIDLYDQNGEIRFGEITFFDGSGYMTFTPDGFDYQLGEAFIIPSGGVIKP